MGPETYHEVTCEKVESLKDDPISITLVLEGNMKLELASYMTSPTGKTNPPRTLARPGFEEFKDGEPPIMMRSRRPPNDSIMPAMMALTNVLS